MTALTDEQRQAIVEAIYSFRPTSELTVQDIRTVCTLSGTDLNRVDGHQITEVIRQHCVQVRVRETHGSHDRRGWVREAVA